LRTSAEMRKMTTEQEGDRRELMYQLGQARMFILAAWSVSNRAGVSKSVHKELTDMVHDIEGLIDSLK